MQPIIQPLRPRQFSMPSVSQVAHTDMYLDDIWCLDLGKLDGWKCVKENTEGEAVFKGDADWETDSGDTEDSSTE